MSIEMHNTVERFSNVAGKDTQQGRTETAIRQGEKIFAEIFTMTDKSFNAEIQSVNSDRKFIDPQVKAMLNDGFCLADYSSDSKQISVRPHEQTEKHEHHSERFGIDHPYRTFVNELMKLIPESSYEQAIAKFPELNKLAPADTALLIKGIIRNELYHYDRNDLLQDDLAQLGLIFAGGRYGEATLGFTQISANGIAKLEKEFPEQLGKLKGHEAQALEDPKWAPVLVAAVLAHVIKMYEHHHIKPTLENVAYGYNPDVASKHHKGHHELLPDAEQVARSKHVKNVLHQMEQAKQNEKHAVVGP